MVDDGDGFGVLLHDSNRSIICANSTGCFFVSESFIIFPLPQFLDQSGRIKAESFYCRK